LVARARQARVIKSMITIQLQYKQNIDYARRTSNAEMMKPYLSDFPRCDLVRSKAHYVIPEAY
jgi:hypothetical protein